MTLLTDPALLPEIIEFTSFAAVMVDEIFGDRMVADQLGEHLVVADR